MSNGAVKVKWNTKKQMRCPQFYRPKTREWKSQYYFCRRAHVRRIYVENWILCILLENILIFGIAASRRASYCAQAVRSLDRLANRAKN